MKKIPCIPVLLLLAAPGAFAHTGHLPAGGFGHGIVHPFAGIDHLLAMLAVGLWAAQLGGRAVWVVPASFVGTMLAGGALGIAGIIPPFLETGISLSVLLLGLAIAFAVRLPVVFPAALVAVFALFHGAAHGAEMPAASSGAAYALGFALSTAALHAAGIGGGILLGKLQSQAALRFTGALIAVWGAVLLFA